MISFAGDSLIHRNSPGQRLRYGTDQSFRPETGIMKEKAVPLVVVAVILMGGVAALLSMNNGRNQLPDGFVQSNGRIEAHKKVGQYKMLHRLSSLL